MRTFTYSAVLAAVLGLAFLPGGARADGYYYPGYSYAGGYSSSPVYTYTPGYPYGYSGSAHFHSSPGFHYQWHGNAWNAHLGRWGYRGGFRR